MLMRAPLKKLSTQMTFAPCREQALAKVRAEETRSAGHHDPCFKMHPRPSRESGLIVDL